MRFIKTISFFTVAIFFLMPIFFAEAGESPKNLNSICDVVMAHNSLTAEFPSLPINTIKAGETFYTKINIKNKTVYTYRNTRVLYKVYYVTREGDEGVLVDTGLFPNSFDAIGGSEQLIDVNWKSSEFMNSGQYHMDIYVIQNGVHVIGDFARNNSARSYIIFNIEGTDSISPIKIKSDETKIGGADYVKEKMLFFTKDDNDDTAKFVIKNTSKKKQNVSLKWKVFNYGLFEEKDLFLSTSTQFTIEPNKEYEVNLNIPITPSNRYHAFLDVENNNQHIIEMFRWGRGLKAPASLYNYGIVEDGEFLSSNKIEKDFALKKGKRYVAFACIIGGYENDDVTVSMRLKDDRKRVIFSREETKVVGTENGVFEYPFIPTNFSKNMQLDIVVLNSDNETKASFTSDCGNNKDGSCREDSFMPKIKTIYIIPFFIIFVLFIIPYMLGVKR